jgi:hypothetical protein
VRPCLGREKEGLMKTSNKTVLVMTLSAVLAALAFAGGTTPARADEPAISVEWQSWDLGTVAPATSFNRDDWVLMFGLGTTVSASDDSATVSVSPASQFIDANLSAAFSISGTVPATNGPFTITVRFTYSNSSGSGSVPVLITGTVGSSTPSTPTYYVGVIPQTVSSPPSGSDCPGGTSLLYFQFDDEDGNNQNWHDGWIGATISDRNTRLYFCRVDGRQFKPLSSTNSVTNHYAVLKLGTHCPPGSTSFSRYWDHEDINNQNDRWTSSHNNADFFPNSTLGNDDILNFCLFRTGTDTMSQFPDLGFHYGVFAAADFSKAIQTGRVATDDEDGEKDNDNSMTGGADAQRIIEPTTEGRNTTIHMARVSPETRPVAQCDVTPTSAVDSTYAIFSDRGSFARAGRTIQSYSWTFSTGVHAPGPGPYGFTLGVGTYAGTRTVTDSAGESSSAICYVTVTPSDGCFPGPGSDTTPICQ